MLHHNCSISFFLLCFFVQHVAFELWRTHWSVLYPKDSPSRQLIDYIQETYYLVNLVDNDFVSGNVLWRLVDDVLLKTGVITERFNPSLCH